MSRNYEQMSDLELIKKVRSGNFDAFSELGERYDWLIRQKAELFSGISVPEKEDLYQEGYLGFFVAVNSYKDEYKASFKTYAGVCIYNQMVSAIRNYSSMKNEALNKSISLDCEDYEMQGNEETPERLYEIKENYNLIMSRIEEVLSSFEHKILSIQLSGIKRGEIEEKTGIPIKTFDNALHRVRKKLKKLRDDIF